MKIERRTAAFRSEPLEDPEKRGTLRERVVNNEGLQGARSANHPLAHARGSEQGNQQSDVLCS